MMVRGYSLKRDGGKALSANLLVREFACQDGSDALLVADELVAVLQAVRNYFAAPLQVVSGYRTVAHNKAVGGVRNSQHVLGTAADIHVAGKTPLEIYRALDNGWVPGVDREKIGMGLYRTFVHVDVRGHKSRWSA